MKTPGKRKAALSLALAAALLACPSVAMAQGGGPGPAGGPPGSVGGGGAGSGADADRGARSGSGEREVASPGSSLSAFSAWLADPSEMGRYASVLAELRASAEQAASAGVPLEAFVARIREAGAKGVAPAVLAAAIRADAVRWTAVARILRGLAWPPETDRTEFFLSAGNALLNGMGEPALSALVSWAAPAKAPAGRVGAVMGATASVAGGLGLSDGQSARLALALAASRLKVGDLPGVAEAARRARDGGIAPEAFVAAAEEVSRSKGSLRDLLKKLGL